MKTVGGSPLELFLEALGRNGGRLRPCGGGWQAQCPAHDDRAPSLSIRETDDGKVLVHCFSGCETQEILGVLGLRYRDLYPKRKSFRKNWAHTPR